MPSVCLIVCLTHEGQESTKRFEGLLADVRAAAKRHDCMDRLTDALHLHLTCYAPADCLVPLGNPYWHRPRSFAARGLLYCRNVSELSDRERFHHVRGFDKETVAAGELPAMRLISQAHQLSQAQQGPLLTTPVWWNFCAKALGRFLSELDTVWPHDVPLPPLSLSGRLPPDLLRWAFHNLEPLPAGVLAQAPLRGR